MRGFREVIRIKRHELRILYNINAPSHITIH